MEIPKFIVFAHPRSGSTTLANVLGAYPGVRLLMEPFLNPAYSGRIVDIPTMDALLDEIFATFTGIKAISWPLDFELYAHMLADERRKVIFLRRHNLLKASLSNAIAHRTGAWQKSDLPERPEELYARIGEIPVDEITEWIEAVRDVMDQYEAIVDRRPADTTLKITYEELYGSAASQEDTLVRTFAFLMMSSARTPAMDILLEEANSRMNSPETYRWVANLREIEEVGRRMGYA